MYIFSCINKWVFAKPKVRKIMMANKDHFCENTYCNLTTNTYCKLVN